MKVVKQNKGLLIKHLLILLFALFNFFSSVGQPVFGNSPDGNNPEPPEIDVSISDVVFDGLQQEPPFMELYDANIDIDFDFGTERPLWAVREIGFDIRLEGVTSGFFSPLDLQFCNGGNGITVSQPTEDLNLFHIQADFRNGIVDSNTCIFNAVATVALIIDGNDPHTPPGSYIEADCYDDFDNTLVASVEITNGYISYFGGESIDLNDDYYIEEFGVNNCEYPPLSAEREFDVNLVLKNTSSTVVVDVYFRYSEGVNLSTINYGKVWIAHYGSIFNSPTLISPPGLNAQLWTGQNLSTITFNNTAIQNKSLTQIHIGRLVYNLMDPSINSSSEFYAVAGQFNDQIGALSPYTRGYLDVDEFHYVSPFPFYKTTSSKVLQNNSMSAYPVPAKKQVFIKTGFDLSENLQINMFNSTGKIITEADFNLLGDREIQLNVEDLVKGSYIISIAEGNSFSSLKILKH